jgi:hypothetical protein
MKALFLTFFSLVIFLQCNLINAQTYNLSVVEGYGSGNYSAGDTVHIWSKAYDTTKTFKKWTGDIQFLENPNEWHSKLIMPSQNISVSAIIDNMPNYSITFEQIMGQNILKNVYYFFPNNLKGVIYLFHGTGGSANNFINSIENRSFINAAIADGFGIIATEAEEISLNSDLNGDGKLRWKVFPVDTVNGVDYLNIKILTNTFIQRGDFNYSTPIFSVGMSNGGSFSAGISSALNFRAGVSYCASSVQGIFTQRTNPFAFRMAKFDDNDEVGEDGNYEAWQNDSILAAREICHDYKLHDRQPIYPERFARISGISVSNSQLFYNELVATDLIDNENYALHSDTIRNRITENPSLFPNIIQLPPTLISDALSQIAASNAEHKFYSDYNFETLNFFNTLCEPSVGIENMQFESRVWLYPNPASSILYIKSENNIPLSFSISNSLGQLLAESSLTNNFITISHLPKGIYFIRIKNSDNETSLLKFVKE